MQKVTQIAPDQASQRQLFDGMREKWAVLSQIFYA
jgi:hypothetical protein